MVIKPCEDDLISLFAIWPVIILCEVFAAVAGSFNPLFIGGMIVLDICLGISSLRDYVYLGRTIYIDREGCTFRVLGYSKKYNWDSLNVQICHADTFRFSDSDIAGPGLLIGPKAMRNSKHIAPMTYCRYRHPFSSVYIRYRTPKDDLRKVTGKTVYSGFTEDRRILQEVLASAGILL